MFKLPKSFVDTTLHSISYADYFDPRKNALFVTDRKYLLGTELKSLYQAIYSRENILANLEYYFPLAVRQGYGFEDSDVSHMLSKIEDEDLWQLAFLQFSGLGSSNRITWIKHQFQMIDYSTNSRRLDIHYGRTSFNMQYSYRGENFADEIKTILRELGAYFDNTLQPYPNYYVNLDQPVYGNAFLSKMITYSSNRKTYVSSEHTAESLFNEMGLNPTMAVRIVSQAFNSVKISIVNPVTRDNKRALFSALPYSADVLELLPWPQIVKGERSPMLYGVELEVSTQYNCQQLIEASDEPFFACKVDSSITGSMRNKLELVTAPCSMKLHKKEWSHLFSNLDYDLFDTTVDTNNGMHVHIGRQVFTDTHLRTFAWFFGNPCNREFIVALSERKANQMHQYSAMPNWPSNFTKIQSLKTVTSLFDELRGAVNLHKHKPTVEVRIFKGIASYATILKNLEAVDAIFFFTQQCSQTNAGLREFLNFLRKTPRNKYPVLKEFITGLDTKKMLSAAQLNDLVFNVTDPRQIVSIIQKKNFPITSHHVTLLNAKQGVRTFIFNKEHGTIEIVRTKHGKMSHLDRILEKKYTRNNLLNRPANVPIIDTAPVQAPAPVVNLTQGLSLRDYERVRAAMAMDVSVPNVTDDWFTTVTTTVTTPVPMPTWDIPTETRF